MAENKMDISLHNRIKKITYHSELQVAEEFEFTWIVDTFSSFLKSRVSPVISLQFTMYTKVWEIFMIYVNNHIGVKLVSQNTLNALAKCKFLLQKADKTKLGLSSNWIYNSGNDFVHSNLINIGNLSAYKNEFFPEDRLTIVCHVITYKEPKHNLIVDDPILVPDCDFDSNLGVHLKNEKFSDVTILVDDQKYPAHKIVLAARSVVFDAMFNHDMEENSKNQVKITDISKEVFETLLKFLYTGKVDNEAITIDLLSAADKYAVERLKIICAEALYKTLSEENVVELLVLADLHSMKQLKIKAIDFLIGFSLKSILESERTKHLQQHTELFKEVLIAYGIRKDSLILH